MCRRGKHRFYAMLLAYLDYLLIIGSDDYIIDMHYLFCGANNHRQSAYIGDDFFWEAG
jgi:hypothetical protein